MKDIKSHLKHYTSLLLIDAFIFMLSSCNVDEINDIEYRPWEDCERVCVPLGLDFGFEFGTRETSSLSPSTDELETLVDFDTPNECFAIFFDQYKKVKSIEPLYYSEQLTNSHNSASDIGEKIYFAIAYVKSTDISGPNPISYILVVLNGGKLYSEITAKAAIGKSEKDVLVITWYVDQEDNASDIGKNAEGLYTMTNSAYFEDGNLMTLTPMLPPKDSNGNDNYFTTVDEFISSGKQPSATVYVERMVAKFSEPTLSTEVIGSERFFRPSVAVRPLIIYHWENQNMVGEDVDWRIHLLGWAINGEETSSYLFKNIPTSVAALTDWTDWNDPARKRSYWSIDPHYNTGFYPWQYRKAADRTDIISYSAAIAKSIQDASYKPVLKYYKFNDVKWKESTTSPENTIDPYKTDWNLDDRTTLLAGPHLLITAELYLKGETGGDYIEGFGPAKNLYGDRFQRYFKDEKDIFKLFLQDFNYTLATQEEMTFHVHDWDNPDDKVNDTYKVGTTGDCQLYYNDQELTFDLIDEIFENDNIKLFPANVRQGDGRVIPWISGLSVRTPDGNLELKPQISRGEYWEEVNEWTDDMYRSFFYEWFGAIDHYKEGKMYYAGEIQHHKKDGKNNEFFFGTVRNHWYKFTVNSINALGIPVDDLEQRIIPDKYKYNDLLGVQVEIQEWHYKESNVYLE